MDKRIETLADTIVDYSLSIKENERVLITCETLEPKCLVKSLVRKISEKKAIPFVKITDPEISSLINETANINNIDKLKEKFEYEVNSHDVFINIRYVVNDYENKNIDKKFLKAYGDSIKEIQDIKVNNKKWVLLNYPSVTDSYKAKMKIDDYYNFSLDVMNYDYQKMANDMIPLKQLMEKTDKVRLTGEKTDITFSIKDIPVIICAGEKNIPDGEVYTAPVKESINGIITYNTPSPYQGNVFTSVSLIFEDGKIIKATCNEDNEELNKIFDSDEGARYVGEFSIGLNKLIENPIGDILFDEKIIGSIHFTPGRAYKDAYNGNDSQIHWDMVLIQRDDYGGGNIYFDDVLIRENGVFIIDELKHLNK